MPVSFKTKQNYYVTKCANVFQVERRSLLKHYDNMLPCWTLYALWGKPSSAVRVPCLAFHKDALLRWKYTVAQESLEETEVGGRRQERRGRKRVMVSLIFRGPVFEVKKCPSPFFSKPLENMKHEHVNQTELDVILRGVCFASCFL